LAGAFAKALTAGLAGTLAAALAAGLTGCTTPFSPRPLQPLARGDPGCGVVGEDVPICSWSRNLLRIYCIQDLFLQSGQR
jgi:hypothetical protein